MVRRRVHPAVAVSAARRDGRAARGAESAARLVAAAVSILAAQGATGLTLARVAEQVGSSNALVVFHFGSKSGLVRAVLTQLAADYREVWNDLVERPGLDAEARLRAAVGCAGEFARRHPDKVAAWVALGLDGQGAGADLEISGAEDLRYLVRVRQIIADLAAETGEGRAQADALADGLNYLVHGAWYWHHMGPGRGQPPNVRPAAMLLLAQVFPGRFAADAAGLG